MQQQKILVCIIAMSGLTSPVIYADDAAAVYKSKCAICHGADGSGNTPTGRSLKVRDLRSEEVQKMSSEEMEKIIAEGKGKMPAFKSKLAEETIDSLVKWIKSLKK